MRFAIVAALLALAVPVHAQVTTRPGVVQSPDVTSPAPGSAVPLSPGVGPGAAQAVPGGSSTSLGTAPAVSGTAPTVPRVGGRAPRTGAGTGGSAEALKAESNKKETAEAKAREARFLASEKRLNQRMKDVCRGC